MYYLYILYSVSIDQYYTGHTNDVDDRVTRHNEGKSRSTRRGIPWELKFRIGFETRSEAMKAEKWIKKMKSRDLIKRILNDEIDLKKVMNIKGINDRGAGSCVG